MPGIEDFINMFSGSGSQQAQRAGGSGVLGSVISKLTGQQGQQQAGPNIDPQQAAQYADRFTSTRPEDQEFNNQDFQQAAAEHLSKMPEDQFQDRKSVV